MENSDPGISLFPPTDHLRSIMTSAVRVIPLLYVFSYGQADNVTAAPYVLPLAFTISLLKTIRDLFHDPEQHVQQLSSRIAEIFSNATLKIAGPASLLERTHNVGSF